MKKITPYLFALLLITISLYYAKENSTKRHVSLEYTSIPDDTYSHMYIDKNHLEEDDTNQKNLFQNVKNILAYWNLSWHEIQYINGVNKQAMEEYKLAKTQAERNEILKKHPQYFVKIGRPLLNTCTR